MPGCPAPISRAGAVAWCTEKRGIPSSLPCAESGSRWSSEDRRCAAFGAKPVGGKLDIPDSARYGRRIVGFYIGNGRCESGEGNGEMPIDVLQTVAARLAATRRTRAPQSSPMPWCSSSRVGGWMSAISHPMELGCGPARGYLTPHLTEAPLQPRWGMGFGVERGSVDDGANRGCQGPVTLCH